VQDQEEDKEEDKGCEKGADNILREFAQSGHLTTVYDSQTIAVMKTE